MAKKIAEVSDAATKRSEIKNRLRNVYTGHMDALDKSMGLLTGLQTQPRLPSGLRCLDLTFGKAIGPGMCTFLGMEASSKSTASMTILGQAIKYEVPIIKYFDAEGAIDGDYTRAILKVKSLQNVWGVRDEKTQKWLQPPLARYYDTHIIEDIFNSMHHSLNRIPRKRYHPGRDEWFLVFGRTKDDQKLMKEIGIEPDKKLYTETGNYWCSIGDDDSLQAAFFVDSYPALVTEKVDEEEEEGNGLALEARSFSKFVKRVSGKLRSRAAVLVGVNQLRDAPMQKYGPGYTEPGGKALQFFCMTGDTYLLSSKGIITASEMAFKNSPIMGKEGIEKVTNFQYQGHKHISEVTLENGQKLRASNNHAVLAYHPLKGMDFQKMKVLDTKHYVVTKIGQDVWSSKDYKLPNIIEAGNKRDYRNYVTLPTEMSPSLARWLGLIVGDGSVSGATVTYTGKINECEHYQDLCEELFDYRPNIQVKENHGTVGLNSYRIGALLRALDCEHYGLDKVIPRAILRSTRETALEFLGGLFDADGHTSNKCFTFCTISEKLANQVQIMLHNLGIDCKIVKYNPKGFNAGKMRERWAYNIRVCGEALTRMFEIIPCQRLKVKRLGKAQQGAGLLPPLWGWRGMNYHVVSQISSYTGGRQTISPRRLLALKDRLYRKANAARTSHQRSSMLASLDAIFEMVYMYYQGYRWHQVKYVKLNLPMEATFDGTAPNTHTIITNGIVSHNSNARTMLSAVGVPPNFDKDPDNGGICLETSVEVKGGTDRYMFKNIANKKNKGGVPFRKSKCRVWIEDGTGKARGYDPVFDLYNFYDMVGMIEGSRKKFQITGIKQLEGFKFSWESFKTLVLAETVNSVNRKKLRRACQELGIPKFYIGQYADDLLRTGEAERKYISVMQQGKSGLGSLEDLEE